MSKERDENFRLVQGIATRGRTDAYSVFNVATGKGYTAKKEPLTDEVIERHLSNEQPIAIYLFKGSETHLAALDVDVHDGAMPWPEVIARIKPLIEALKKHGLKPLDVRSGGGSGAHIWLIWEHPQPTRRVRRLLTKVLKSAGFRNGTKGLAEGTIEIYPKQDEVKEGKMGNVIALLFARQSVPLDEDLEPIDLGAYQAPSLETLFSDPLPEEEEEKQEEAQEQSQPRELPQTRPAPSHLEQPLGDLEDVVAALKHISADDYDMWVKVGLALKHTFGGAGYAAWAAWSASSAAKFPGEAACREVWDRFEPSGELTLGTLFHEAQQRGWNGPSDPVIREMNASYGIYTGAGQPMIIDKQPEDPSGVGMPWLSMASFNVRLAGETLSFDAPDGKQIKIPKAKHWLSHPKAAHYHRIVFDPSLPPGHNGKAWNIWSGFAATPKPGSWRKFQGHVQENICGGDEEKFQWLMNWLALGVQQPGLVIGTAPVLCSVPGTGKGVLAHGYGSLWGRHYASVTHTSHVSGRFNAHLFGRRLIFIDEGMFGGNRQDAGVIKTRVTEPKIMLEAKGVDPIWIDNHMILIVSSNERSIVPADIADRRWQVFEVSEAHREDKPYFAAIADELDNGGREAMLHDLLHRDISKGPDPRKTIKTAGLFDQIIQAQGPEVRYLYQVLDQGVLPQPWAPNNGPGITTIKALHEEMRASQASSQYVQMTMLGKMIRQVIPGVQTVQSGCYIDPRDYCGRRQRSTRYEFPPLPECRRAFEAYVGQPIEWSDVDAWQDDLEDDDDADDEGGSRSDGGGQDEMPF